LPYPPYVPFPVQGKGKKTRSLRMLGILRDLMGNDSTHKYT